MESTMGGFSESEVDEQLKTLQNLKKAGMWMPSLEPTLKLWLDIKASMAKLVPMGKRRAESGSNGKGSHPPTKKKKLKDTSDESDGMSCADDQCG